MTNPPLLLTVILACLPAIALAQKNTAHHRAVYAEINANQDSYRYAKAILEEEPADVTLEGWYDGDTLRKIVATIPGEHGTGVEEYYFEGGEPLFGYTKYDTVDIRTDKVVAVLEDRYYFRNGEMFKWLDSDKESVSPRSADFKEEAEALKSDCALFIDILGKAAPSKRKPSANHNSGMSESAIRKFLYSLDGTYGWETKSDDISYDFFPDGRLHIEGPDGEATMWTGTWKLTGDQLTLICREIDMNQTVTATVNGEVLRLGKKKYTRYQP